ncbi:MAG: hypothetical protein AB7Q17_07465 [Phycisphaerae bacterium]
MQRNFRLAVLTTATLVALATLAGCPQPQNPDNTGGTGDTGGNHVARAFVPSGVTLDVSELDTTEQQSRVSVQEYVSIVRSARNITRMFQNAADAALVIAATVADDITSLSQTQVAGEFNINGAAVDYRCDFSAFDFDGDGDADGSGLPNTTPVAFRIWTDRGTGFQPFMCGLITTLPGTGTAGAGAIIAAPFNADASAQPDVQIRVEWDRTAAGHRWNQAYISGTLDPIDGVVIDIGHARVDVRDSGAFGFEKTVRGTAAFDQHPADFDSIQVATHFAPGTGALLLNAQSAGGTSPFNEASVCLSRTDFNDATGGACADFDTQDMNFLDVPIGGENDFPAGFPATPTF